MSLYVGRHPGLVGRKVHSVDVVCVSFQATVDELAVQFQVLLLSSHKGLFLKGWSK